MKNFSELQVNTRSSYREVFCEKMFLKILQISQKKRLCWSPFYNKAAGWKPETVRSSHWKCFVKKGVLKKHWCFRTSRSYIPLHKIDVLEQFTKFTAKYLCWSLFLIKLQFWGPAALLKKTPTQVPWNLQTF